MEGEKAGEETKICSNCKRDIPRVNFLVHSVHCARNIRPCAACKEPVPLSELQEHHDRLHKLQPCKACGESVCGSDLEDHVRDSCANTVRPCRFCELELPRKKLPQHEGYCGSRTEQCGDCREWVQLKYHQLHLDSNHGFIKLDDEPPPIPQLPRPGPSHNRPVATTSWSNMNQPDRTTVAATTGQPAAISTSTGLNKAMKQMNVQKRNEQLLKPVPNTSTSNEVPGSSNASSSHASNDIILQRPYTAHAASNISQRHTVNGSTSNGDHGGLPTGSNGLLSNDVSTPGRNRSGARPKRTNDRPQVNTSVAGAEKVTKEATNGVIKKRPAPKPPAPSPQRDLALRGALARHRDEEAARLKQNALNAAMGLPPVLTAAEKLEKLRKMDALHSRETQEPDYSQRLRGQCWQRDLLVSPGERLGSGPLTNPRFLLGNPGDQEVDGREESPAEIQVGWVAPVSGPRRPKSACERRSDLNDLKPMSQAQFLDRFQEIHNGRSRADNDRRGEEEDRRGAEGDRRGSEGDRRGGEGDRRGGEDDPRGAEGDRRGAEAPGGREDRFSEIKTSLRELRRGLNEVTAPYNASSNININNNHGSRPSATPAAVRLPCEFCGVLVPSEDLVLHQTGCRPDLVGYSPRPPPGRSPSPPRRSPSPPRDPVIPCEFCAESLPVYLINDHQERCRRENDGLYLD